LLINILVCFSTNDIAVLVVLPSSIFSSWSYFPHRYCHPGRTSLIDIFVLVVLQESLHLVDMPGHSRLRSLVDRRLPHARAIILMVDAVDFMPTARTTAE
jgi:hypothetical protein